MPSDRDCRCCARRAEYNGSMAALNLWKAAVLVASMPAATEEDRLRQVQALARLQDARTYLGDANTDAARKIKHHGPQRTFACFDPQLSLVA